MGEVARFAAAPDPRHPGLRRAAAVGPDEQGPGARSRDLGDCPIGAWEGLRQCDRGRPAEAISPVKRDARLLRTTRKKREARLRELPKAGVGAWSRIQGRLTGRRYGSTVSRHPQDIDTCGQTA